MKLPTLAHAFVTAPDRTPSRWMLFLHGIFGSGNNFRTLARRWVAAHPDLGLVLVDLRMHGRSQGFPPPHTIAAAAQDLSELETLVHERGGTVVGVVGHSFGGKVALEYVANKQGQLEQAWILDSTPGIRSNFSGTQVTLGVYNLLRTLPPVFPSRAEFNQMLTAAGLEQGIVQWLAMNVDATEGGYRFRLDMSAIGALLDDYFARDLWPVVENPPGNVVVHLVIGGRSQAFDEVDRARAEKAATQQPDRIVVHTIPDAGHWLHVDAPDALFEMLSGASG